MSKNINLWLYIGIAIIMVVGVGALISYAQVTDPQETGTPQITVNPATLDWGVISAAQGPVSKQFTITNTGDGDLIIKKIATSCGCTTAVLKTAAGATPRLGMDHGNLPAIRAKIAPGETAELTVTFDPNFHYVRGKTSRVIYITSNDPSQKEIDVVSQLTVTD